jgi:hypothetical protein
MSVPITPEDDYETNVRRLCMQCGHAFVWHGVANDTSLVDPDLYAPDGCGVAGCTCDRLDPEGG